MVRYSSSFTMAFYADTLQLENGWGNTDSTADWAQKRYGCIPKECSWNGISEVKFVLAVGTF
jgi:hypothetical protein